MDGAKHNGNKHKESKNTATKYEDGSYEDGKYIPTKYNEDKYTEDKYNGAKYDDNKYVEDKYNEDHYVSDRYNEAKYNDNKYKDSKNTATKYEDGSYEDGKYNPTKYNNDKSIEDKYNRYADKNHAETKDYYIDGKYTGAKYNDDIYTNKKYNNTKYDNDRYINDKYNVDKHGDDGYIDDKYNGAKYDDKNKSGKYNGKGYNVDDRFKVQKYTETKHDEKYVDFYDDSYTDDEYYGANYNKNKYETNSDPNKQEDYDYYDSNIGEKHKGYKNSQEYDERCTCREDIKEINEMQQKLKQDIMKIVEMQRRVADIIDQIALLTDDESDKINRNFHRLKDLEDIQDAITNHMDKIGDSITKVMDRIKTTDTNSFETGGGRGIDGYMEKKQTSTETEKEKSGYGDSELKCPGLVESGETSVEVHYKPDKTGDHKKGESSVEVYYKPDKTGDHKEEYDGMSCYRCQNFDEDNGTTYCPDCAHDPYEGLKATMLDYNTCVTSVSYDRRGRPTSRVERYGSSMTMGMSCLINIEDHCMHCYCNSPDCNDDNCQHCFNEAREFTCYYCQNFDKDNMFDKTPYDPHCADDNYRGYTEHFPHAFGCMTIYYYNGDGRYKNGVRRIPDRGLPKDWINEKYRDQYCERSGHGAQETMDCYCRSNKCNNNLCQQCFNDSYSGGTRNHFNGQNHHRPSTGNSNRPNEWTKWINHKTSEYIDRDEGNNRDNNKNNKNNINNKIKGDQKVVDSSEYVDWLAGDSDEDKYGKYGPYQGKPGRNDSAKDWYRENTERDPDSMEHRDYKWPNIHESHDHNSRSPVTNDKYPMSNNFQNQPSETNHGSHHGPHRNHTHIPNNEDDLKELVSICQLLENSNDLSFKNEESETSGSNSNKGSPLRPHKTLDNLSSGRHTEPAMKCYHCIGVDCIEVNETTDIETSTYFTSCYTGKFVDGSSEAIFLRGGSIEDHTDGECIRNDKQYVCYCSTNLCNSQPWDEYDQKTDKWLGEYVRENEDSKIVIESTDKIQGDRGRWRDNKDKEHAESDIWHDRTEDRSEEIRIEYKPYDRPDTDNGGRDRNHGLTDQVHKEIDEIHRERDRGNGESDKWLGDSFRENEDSKIVIEGTDKIQGDRDRWRDNKDKQQAESDIWQDRTEDTSEEIRIEYKPYDRPATDNGERDRNHGITDQFHKERDEIHRERDRGNGQSGESIGESKIRFIDHEKTDSRNEEENRNRDRLSGKTETWYALKNREHEAEKDNLERKKSHGDTGRNQNNRDRWNEESDSWREITKGEPKEKGKWSGHVDKEHGLFNKDYDTTLRREGDSDRYDKDRGNVVTDRWQGQTNRNHGKTERGHINNDNWNDKMSKRGKGEQQMDRIFKNTDRGHEEAGRGPELMRRPEDTIRSHGERPSYSSALECYRCHNYQVSYDTKWYDRDCGHDGYNGLQHGYEQGHTCVIYVYYDRDGNPDGRVSRFGRVEREEDGACLDYPDSNRMKCFCSGNTCNNNLCQHCFERNARKPKTCYRCHNDKNGKDFDWYDPNCGDNNYDGLLHSYRNAFSCVTFIYYDEHGIPNGQVARYGGAQEEKDGVCQDYPHQHRMKCFCSNNHCNRNLCRNCFDEEVWNKRNQESPVKEYSTSKSSYESTSERGEKGRLECYHCLGDACKELDRRTDIDASKDFASCFTAYYIDGSTQVVFRGGDVDFHEEGECIRKGREIICFCNRNRCNNENWHEVADMMKSSDRENDTYNSLPERYRRPEGESSKEVGKPEPEPEPEPSEPTLRCYHCLGVDCRKVNEKTDIETSVSFTSCYTGQFVDGSSEGIFRGGDVDDHTDGECIGNAKQYVCYCSTNLCNSEPWDEDEHKSGEEIVDNKLGFEYKKHNRDSQNRGSSHEEKWRNVNMGTDDEREKEEEFIDNKLGFESKKHNRDSQNRASSQENKWGNAIMGTDDEREKEGYGPAGEDSKGYGHAADDERENEGYGPAGEDSSFSTSASYETSGRESGTPGEWSETEGRGGSGERVPGSGSKGKSESKSYSEGRLGSESELKAGKKNGENSKGNPEESEKETENETDHSRVSHEGRKDNEHEKELRKGDSLNNHGEYSDRKTDHSRGSQEREIKLKENDSEYEKDSRKGDSSNRHGEDLERKSGNEPKEFPRTESTNRSHEISGTEKEIRSDSRESENNSGETHDNKPRDDPEPIKEDIWSTSREKSVGETRSRSEKTSGETENESREKIHERDDDGTSETNNSRSEEKDDGVSEESKRNSKESDSESRREHGGETRENKGSKEESKDNPENKSIESEENSGIEKESSKRKYRKVSSLPKKPMEYNSEQHKPARKFLECYNCIGTDCRKIGHTTEKDSSDTFVSCYTGHYIDGSSDIIFRGGEVQAHKDGECLKKGHKTICYCSKNLCNNKLWDDLKQTASFYKRRKKHQ